MEIKNVTVVEIDKDELKAFYQFKLEKSKEEFEKAVRDVSYYTGELWSNKFTLKFDYYHELLSKKLENAKKLHEVYLTDLYKVYPK